MHATMHLQRSGPDQAVVGYFGPDRAFLCRAWVLRLLDCPDGYYPSAVRLDVTTDDFIGYSPCHLFVGNVEVEYPDATETPIALEVAPMPGDAYKLPGITTQIDKDLAGWITRTLALDCGEVYDGWAKVYFRLTDASDIAQDV